MAIDLTTSKRMIAVKQYAEEHKAERSEWAEMLELDDQQIFSVIKKTRKPETAIRTMRRHLGIRSTQTQSRVRTSSQIRRELIKNEGPQMSMSVCGTCLASVYTLEDLQNHECFGPVNVEVDLASARPATPEELEEISRELLDEYALVMDICAGCGNKFKATGPSDEHCTRCVVNAPIDN